MARIFLIHDDGREEGPFTVRDLRDRLALKMVDPRHPCRFHGEPGRYVAGEICSGSLFAELEAEDPDGPVDPLDGWIEAEIEDAPVAHRRVPMSAQAPATIFDDDPEEDVWVAGEEEEIAAPLPARFPMAPTEPIAAPCLWSARPGFLHRVRAAGWAVLFAGAAGAAAWLSWSGWIAAALASASCACLALAIIGGGRRVHRIFPTHVESARRGLGGGVTEVPLRRIEAVNVSRSGPAALLGFGSLHIDYLKPDGSPGTLHWRGIHRPGRARDLLRQLRRPQGEDFDDEED